VTSTEPIRVLFADDHWIVRQGLGRYLSADDSFEVVGEAADGSEAVKLANTLQPDVVLMDLLMPGLDGVAATAAITRTLPGVAVVAFTSAVDSDLVVEAVRAGAIGILYKDSGGEELKQALRAAAAGQVQLSPAIASRLVREIQLPRPLDLLTDRERDVLRLLGRGLSNKEIARQLDIGEGTVRTHVTSILSKLRLQGRTRAALAAVELGLVTPDQLRRG
jgi:two-component system, NarL family, response regulator LiaR